jgi:hypothetical protein
MICPGLVADDLSGFWRVSKSGDRDATRGTDGEYIEGLERYRAGRLSCEEAAELLGISERHFRRLRDRYEAEGAEGLIDRRRGRVSGQRAPVDQIEFVVEQYRTRYWDFTVKHFHEALQTEHGVSPRLHLDQDRIAEPGSGAGGTQARGASQETAAAAAARDDVVPGRLNARVAGGATGARSDRHLG